MNRLTTDRAGNIYLDRDSSGTGWAIERCDSGWQLIDFDGRCVGTYLLKGDALANSALDWDVD
jgi:hypothetical protein